MDLLPAVTIVVPVFITPTDKTNDSQRLKWLHSCVESCARQYPAYPFIIQIWNDGSPSPRINQAIKVISRRWNCEAYDCTRKTHKTAGWIMNETLNNCKTKYIFWIGCDDEIHPQFLQYCIQAWNRTEEGEQILGTGTDCMRETKINGQLKRENWAAASSPVYDTKLIQSHTFNEDLEHAIDGTFQEHFFKQGYTIRKVSLPLYLYRFHDSQLSRGIHHDLQHERALEQYKRDMRYTEAKL